MATAQSTLALSPVQQNVDLLRRYCPTLAASTHDQVAACLFVDDQGCWPWPGTLTAEGYGYVWLEPTPYGYCTSCGVHRYMYDLLVGEIPSGYHVHHRCEHKPCWHPLHLEPVTPKEHCARHRHTPPVPAPPTQAPPQPASRQQQLVLLL